MFNRICPIVALLITICYFSIWSHKEPSAIRDEDKEAEDKINSEWEDGEEDEKGKWEENQENEQIEKKYELLKSASLDSVVMEVESESISEPQPLTQETRALTASELLLNKWDTHMI